MEAGALIDDIVSAQKDIFRRLPLDAAIEVVDLIVCNPELVVFVWAKSPLCIDIQWDIVNAVSPAGYDVILQTIGRAQVGTELPKVIGSLETLTAAGGELPRSWITSPRAAGIGQMRIELLPLSKRIMKGCVRVPTKS